ncbi:two-component system regulatory protein YycI [Halalkalibacillus halophilus]|uniref:two-component system regulatory protein YycI n=1 Tax=Halalkalibacillus halophilus TaxID=392827 RepID=UPI0004034E99|nr:two-component system regulatory protein YycI [Halalkalibacillus halophilus]
MQWGEIKTLFIVSFLILNIFLLQQFLDKIEETNIETLAQTTFEDRLDAEEIELGELPERGQRETYVSSQRYTLTEEDLEYLEESLDNQENNVVENEIILGEFSEPVEIDLEENRTDSLTSFKNRLLFGSEYTLWEHREEDNMLLFFQEKNGRPIYYNLAGVLAVELNEDGDAIRYAQSILEDVEVQSEEQTVLDPINAIEVLYTNDALESQDELTDMSLGYHTLVPLEDGVQIFAPTWKMTINEEDTYFVNAMEGQLIPNNEEEFVQQITQYMEYQVEQLIRSESE